MSPFLTSWSYIRRSPFQALAAVFVLSITFFVATIFSILIYSSNQLLTYFESRPQVVVFLKNEATADEVSNLQRKLDANLNVVSVKYVSKEEALEIYKKATQDNPLLGELVSPSIFPASLEFSLTDLNFAGEVINQVKSEKIVDNVGFTASVGGGQELNEVVDRLKTIVNYIRYGGLEIAGMLIFTSLVVLLVLISMRITSRKKEIEILTLLGATKGFIRAPIMFEAINYAFLGVFIGWLSGTLLILYVTPTILTYFSGIAILPEDSLKFFGLLGMIFGIEFIIGLAIAIMGSFISISRVKTRK